VTLEMFYYVDVFIVPIERITGVTFVGPNYYLPGDRTRVVRRVPKLPERAARRRQWNAGSEVNE